MVKEGYKQTEIGMIPEDWEANQLGQLAKVRMCKRIFAEQTTEEGDIPFYKIGTFGGKPDAHISRKQYEEYKSKYSYPKPGDILVSAAGTLGRTVVYDGKDAYFQDSNIVWLDVDKRILCNEYLKHYYNVIKWASSEGSTISRLYNGIIESTYIAYPKDLKEQSRIAEALSDTDELISSLEKLIAKKKAIKQGAMQQLLTGKTRLPGYKKEWKTIQIKSLGKMMGGGTPSTKNADWWNGFIPWISSSDLSEESINNITITRFITQEAINSSATILCPQKSILIVTRVGVGKVAIAPCNLCTSQDFTNLIVEEHCPEFIAYIIANVMKEKAQKTQGTSIKGVTSNDIASIELMIPEKTEQEAIAEVLQNIDRGIDALRIKLLKMQQLKQGMMQQLLTGQIRLM